MIIKFSLKSLSIFFLLVILFPLIQNQWLNLYLFNTNNFTIYKFLYYLSGILFPLLVSINSINKFTNYRFCNNKIKNNSYIRGKLLLISTLIILITLSTLILNYVLMNFKLFITESNYLSYLGIGRQILIVIIISILLLFKNTKLFLKTILLMNFFIFSMFIWYSQINNLLLDNSFRINNIYFINILFLLAIETLYYLWSYISYGSNLSDWSVPKLKKNEVLPIFKIIIFYLLILLYYSILF